jgi:hypothetical protein
MFTYVASSQPIKSGRQGPQQASTPLGRQNDILRLQRLVENRAVRDLLRSGAPRSEAPNAETGGTAPGSLARWGLCRMLGMECTLSRHIKGQRCEFVDCERSYSWILPGAVSPGICIYICPPGTICACVLVQWGDDPNQVCIWDQCEESGGQPNTAERRDRLAARASAAVRRRVPHEMPRSPARETLSRQSAPPTQPPAVANYSAPVRQHLTYRTDFGGLETSIFFLPRTESEPRAGFTANVTRSGPSASAAWLELPLRRIALSVFHLHQTNPPPTRQQAAEDGELLNTTVVVPLDLSGQFSPSGSPGPNSRFRFTAVAAPRRPSSRVRHVDIVIEDLGAAPTTGTARGSGETPAQRRQRFQRDYGIYNADPDLIADDVFDRLLDGLSMVPDSMLRSVRDIPVRRPQVGDAQIGAEGQVAEYVTGYQNGTWTRAIVVYGDLLTTAPATIADTIAHEIGHAISSRRREIVGRTGGQRVSATPAFHAAVAADGGLARGLTTDRRTRNNYEEYFAEAYMLFVRQPATLEMLRPNVFAFLRSHYSAAPAAPAANVRSSSP